MFQSLNSALKGQTESKDDSTDLILVSHTPTTSPSAVVANFVSSSLGNGHHVCLVTLHNTWGHYCNIGNKLGLNLRQQQDQGNIKVIDGLKLLLGVLDTDNDNPEGGGEQIASTYSSFQSECSPSSQPFGFILDPVESPLKNLYNLIKQAVEPWKQNGKQFRIVLENVSSFLSMGVHSKDIKIFVNYCWGLTGRCTHKISSNLSGKCCVSNWGSLVVVTTVDEDDDDANNLTTSIGHSASLHLALMPLSTGHSREIHGQLTITVYDRDLPDQCSPNVQLFHYKLEEKNMKVFAPGISPNIL